MQRLEEHIGAALFDRNHAGVRPTVIGELFLQEALHGLDHLKWAVQQVAEVQRGEDGHLRIAISVPVSLLGGTLTHFRRESRSVSIEMIEGAGEASITLVQQRKADIAFVAEAPDNAILRTKYLGDATMMAVVPKFHHMAGSPSALVEDFRSEQFILSASGVGRKIGRYLEGQLARIGKKPIIQWHLLSRLDLLSLVAQGFGVTIIAGTLEAMPDGVAVIPLAKDDVLPVHAVWVGSNTNPALQGFLDTMSRSVP
ncbi:MAG: hypothetical protein ABS76_32000 [Pelagibacterium sp. SCN 64-44]|nr:MAG: hypothetical protein ABS76_32000 [Pelagibacterium sp. SCN 64-44]